MISRFFQLALCAPLLLTFCATADQAPFSHDAPQKARIIAVEDRDATDMFLVKSETIPNMIERGVLQLTGKTNVAQAWRSLISEKDVVGIKVFSSPGPHNGTRPAVVGALVESLLKAKISTQNIIIWDRQMGDLIRAGYVDLAKKYGVRIKGAAQEGWDENVAYDSAIIGIPIWGDLEFEKKGDKVGRKSFVTKLLTKEVTKIISVAPLLNNNYIGVSGHFYSVAMGSVDNLMRFENNIERLTTAVPEIFGLPEIFDRFTLGITDSLIGQYEGEQRTLLHYSTALNQLWFSKDPVALDVHAVQELGRYREPIGFSRRYMELYQNATLLELGVSDASKIAVELVK